MEKRTVGILGILVIALLGISGLILAFVGGIPILVSYLPFMHGAALSIPGSSNAPNFAVVSELGSCCICIPIPLAFGCFALYQHVKGRVVEEPRADI